MQTPEFASDKRVKDHICRRFVSNIVYALGQFNFSYNVRVPVHMR